MSTESTKVETDDEAWICYQAMDFTRAAFVTAGIDEAIWFRVIMELEAAFVSLGVDKEAIRNLMKAEKA